MESNQIVEQSIKPEIWSPNASANWSLIFSPSFGAFLHARNAKVLGRPEEAANNMKWFYGNLVWFGIMLVVSVFVPAIPDMPIRLINVVILLTWYFKVGKKQIKYVKDTYGSEYQKKPWGKPLMIALGCLIAYLIIGFVLISFYVGAAENLVNAAREGNISTVKTLLARGTDVNAKINSADGATALMMASFNNHLDVAQVLLAKGADANAKTNSEFTALMGASNNGYIDIVKALLAKGADVNAKNNKGWTALMMASFNSHFGIVQVLIAKDADVNAKANDGWTALMDASQPGHLDIVQALLAKGADVNAKADKDVTALMLASFKGHLDVVQTLLDKGADVNAKDNIGKTALSLAKEKGYNDIAQLLIKAGAKE
jgi:ankyrin repeat protein